MHSGDVIGLIGLSFVVLMSTGLAAGAAGWAGIAFSTALGCLLLHWARKSRQRRSTRQKLLSDAEFQHAMLLQGDDRVGVYGRYQPAPPVIVSNWGRK